MKSTLGSPLHEIMSQNNYIPCLLLKKGSGKHTCVTGELTGPQPSFRAVSWFVSSGNLKKSLKTLTRNIKDRSGDDTGWSFRGEKLFRLMGMGHVDLGRKGHCELGPMGHVSVLLWVRDDLPCVRRWGSYEA